MPMLLELWRWWQGDGTPAAAIQQLFFIVLTAVATVVALINLSTWKRQLQANVRASAIKELLDTAALVCEQILIERLSPSPMVVFRKLNGFNREWQHKATAAIDREIAFWKEQRKVLEKRAAAFRLTARKNSHVLANGNDLEVRVAELLSQVKYYLAAISEREALIANCRALNTPQGYGPLVSLASLSKRHPLLWRKERNLQPLEFEEAVRRSMDALRAILVRHL